MRIAHVTATFLPYPSGTGMVCYHNALGLARLGHDVHVFTSNHPDKPYDYPEELSVHRLAPIFRIGNAPLLPGLVTLKNFDVVHLHWPFIFGAEIIWLLSLLKGTPFMITHHNDLIGDGMRRYIFDAYTLISSNLVLRRASRFGAVSMDHAANCGLTPHFKKRWEDVVEIPNGVDDTAFVPGLDTQKILAKHQLTEENEIVMFVGGLDRAHHFKGVEFLIKAFAQLDRPNAVLMIVGDGDLRDHYEALARSLKIEERTIFTGAVMHDELPLYYNAASVTVLASTPPESFGMVLIESLACGTPVIASDIPGVRSVVSPGSDGLLTPMANIPELTRSLQTMLNFSQEERKTMGMTGRHKVEQKYAWPQIVRKLESTYEAILANQT